MTSAVANQRLYDLQVVVFAPSYIAIDQLLEKSVQRVLRYCMHSTNAVIRSRLCGHEHPNCSMQ